MKNTFIFIFLLMAIASFAQQPAQKAPLVFSKVAPGIYRADFCVSIDTTLSYTYDYLLQRNGMVNVRRWNTPLPWREIMLDSVTVRFKATLTQWWQDPNNSNNFREKTKLSSSWYIINPRENFYVREDTGEKFYFQLVKRERKPASSGQ
jgi:hypothetical protein